MSMTVSGVQALEVRGNQVWGNTQTFGMYARRPEVVATQSGFVERWPDGKLVIMEMEHKR